MGNWTVKPLDEMQDVLGDYPGEMRMATYEVGAEQVALTYRRMPAKTGGKGSYGHAHKTQEELYLVLSGTLQFKLDDEVVDVPAADGGADRARGGALGVERGARGRRARDRLGEDRRPAGGHRPDPELLARVGQAPPGPADLHLP